MEATPLWNAQLLWLERTTENALACAQWYARLLGDTLEATSASSWVLRGEERTLLFSEGARKTVPLVAYAFPTQAQLTAYRLHLESRAQRCTAAATPYREIAGDDSFTVTDPDGRVLVFCVRPIASTNDHASLPARLQHFVCASTQTTEMLRFYREVLGFIESDRVVDAEGALSAAFVRSDAEHHSFAVFRAPASGPDHHAYELPDWNAIRDWADRCGDLEIPLWWGPGRHGVGNNLFFMVEDPDGYKVEFSAEIEQMSPSQAYRTWPHGPRALNLWGSAWMRS
jgi:catechol 2,3-dioxygenase